MHGGPGATQPGGVGPGVSQRFDSPLRTVVVVPGLNGLALNDPVWVRFAVMSLIRTTEGAQDTLGFQDDVGEGASDSPACLCDFA